MAIENTDDKDDLNTEVETIHDTLTAAYERMEAAETDAEAGNDPALKPGEGEADPALETGDPAPAAAPAEGDAPPPVVKATDGTPGDEPGGEPAPSDTGDGVEMPGHWDPQFKEDFDKLPPNAKQFLVNRHKDMEADYTRKRQSDADAMREFEPVRQIMAPFRQQLQANNMSEAQLIMNWARAENQLNTDPVGAIKRIADYYGVDLAEAAALPAAYTGQQPSGNPNGYQADPVIQNLTHQVQSLSQTITGQQAAAAGQQIDAFADQKDDKGQPLHPYFDDVIQDMMQLAQLDKSQGKQPQIDDLYERACWMNTAIREKLVTANAQAEAQRLKAEQAAEAARLQAAKSRNAASSVTGDPSGAVTDPPKQYGSLREQLSEQYDELAGNV